MDSLAGKLAGARARLAAAGIAPDDAAIDVDLYARTLLDWDRATLVTEQTGPVPDQLEPVFSSWIERRARHEPSAYIVGYREFYGLRFRVSPAVLIPRPETEFIVEEALPILTALPRPRLADLGTGSGCLAVTLAHEVPSCRVVATDVSRDALEVARLNARRLGVEGRVDFLQTSYLDGVRGPLDLVVANPPYVRELDRRGLSATVRYEPEVALFGGADGLSALAGALDASARALRQGGWLIMEFGYGQEDALADLVAARPGLRLDRVRSDYQQIPRTAVIARR